MDNCFDRKATSPFQAQQLGWTYNEAIKWGQDEERACKIPTDQISHSNAQVENQLDVAKERKEKVLQQRRGMTPSVADDSGVMDDSTAMDTSSTQPEVKYDWEKNNVKEEWLKIMKQYQANKLPVDKIENDPAINTWFEYLPDPDEFYEHSKYRCKICNRNWRRFYIHEHYLTNLAKSEGVFHQIAKANKDEIIRHPNSGTHKFIIQQLKEEEDQRVDDQISGLISDSPENAVTNRHFRLVYSGNLMLCYK